MSWSVVSLPGKKASRILVQPLKFNILILLTEILFFHKNKNVRKVAHIHGVILPNFQGSFCPFLWHFNIWRLKEREKINCPNIDPLYKVGAPDSIAACKLIILFLPPAIMALSCVEGQWLHPMQRWLHEKAAQSHLGGDLSSEDGWFKFRFVPWLWGLKYQMG